MKKIFLLIMLLGFPAPAWAEPSINQTQPQITESIVEHGILMYNKGNLPAAIDDFSQALLMEPSHKVAADYLMKIGRIDSLDLDTKISLLAFRDLMAQAENQKQKIKYYK